MRFQTQRVSLIILLLASSAGCWRARDHVRLVKVGVAHGPTHSFTQALERFGRNVEAKAGDRFRVKLYPNAQFGGEKEMQEMLTLGTLELTITGVLNTYEPLFALFELPYLYRDREHVKLVNNGPIVREVARSLLPKGLRLIGFVENGFRNITNSVRPIHSPQDVRGLIIRTPENPAQFETFRALGAIPTPLSYSELYTALLQGVVDGQENPLQNIWLDRLYEAQRYVAMTRHIYSASHVLVSERFWQSLSVEDRDLFQECMNEATEWQLDYMADLDSELEEKLKEAGMEFTYPDRESFARATNPAYEAMYERLGSGAREIVQRIRESE